MYDTNKNPRIDKHSTKFWYNEKGQIHRSFGPAIIYRDGREEWWINGKQVKPKADFICPERPNKFVKGRKGKSRKVMKMFRKKKRKLDW